jgi:hypothetical protein
LRLCNLLELPEGRLRTYRKQVTSRCDHQSSEARDLWLRDVHIVQLYVDPDRKAANQRAAMDID